MGLVMIIIGGVVALGALGIMVYIIQDSVKERMVGMGIVCASLAFCGFLIASMVVLQGFAML